MCRGLLAGMVLLAWIVLGRGLAVAGEAAAVFEREGDVVKVRAGGAELEIALAAPAVVIGEKTYGNAAPREVRGELGGGEPVVASYDAIPVGAAKLEMELRVQWSRGESVLRKWAKVRLVGGEAGAVLKEVVLERIDPRGESFWTHGVGPRQRVLILDGPQSHPVFLPGRFVGIEYPVACVRMEGKTLVLAHRPGAKLEPGTWHESRRAVYGLAPVGGEFRRFQEYLEPHRPKPSSLHVNYNSWWTSPVPYSEGDILGLMRQFEEKLVEPHGARMDTFCIDMGWSNRKSLWEIDRGQFPEGFARICKAAEKMQSRLGLWISPSSCYPDALDPAWAKEHGYESISRKGSFSLLCLGGKKYAEGFRARLAELVGRYRISHLKFDGYWPECPEKDHGHEPGAYSAEAIAEGVIAAAEAARRANGEVWIETTCFGYNPSPWWLCSMNSVIGSFGDDAPAGRVAAPVYRESYTTARDYFNLQGTALSPIPASCQEVLGIIHQTAEPFVNDAVMTVLRGHRFLPVYVNPKFMSDSRWKALAELLTWARAHEEILSQTTALVPESWQKGGVPQFTDQGAMPREPYGYAHTKGDRMLVALRNPWIAPGHYRLTLDGVLGLAAGARGLSAVSVYPEARRYGAGLKQGDVLDVPLAPYETVVLAIGPGGDDAGVPEASTVVGRGVSVLESKHRLERVAFRGDEKPLGPSWTSRLGEAASAVRLSLEARVRVDAPSAELLVLCEGKKSPSVVGESIRVNGQKVDAATTTSAVGWRATGLAIPEHWTFVRVPLSSGEQRVALEQYVGDDCARVSAWLWATKAGGAPATGQRLPQPETISLGGAALVEPIEMASLPTAAVVIDRPVDRIDGVYLDSLEPVLVRQGYGTLQKNRSVWEKPMTIGGKHYLRGLGTHAPSRIVYNLEGKYRRFQAWAGADAATAPTITFEVRLDGVRKWGTGLMTRDKPAARVDLDVTGVKTLELVVGDAGNNGADHADWADAMLLR